MHAIGQVFGRQGGPCGVLEQVGQSGESRVGPPVAACGEVQVPVHGLGESAQCDLFGYRDAAQLGDEGDAYAGGDQGELDGEVGGFGDRVGGEAGQPAGPLDHLVAGPSVVRNDPVLVGVVGQPGNRPGGVRVRPLARCRSG